MRRYLMISVALLAACCALAQGGRVYIEDFEIVPDSTLTVPVMLANTDSTRGVQFNMTLPDGLSLEEYSATAYSKSYDMTMTTRWSDAGNYYLVILFPSSRICFPPATADVIQFTFKADADFKGGDIALWKCRGSTIDNKAIPLDGDTTTVSVPASSLIGIPIDQQPVKDQFFNLQGMPVASPDTSLFTIRVSTWADGRQTTQKLARGH